MKAKIGPPCLRSGNEADIFTIALEPQVIHASVYMRLNWGEEYMWTKVQRVKRGGRAQRSNPDVMTDAWTDRARP